MNQFLSIQPFFPLPGQTIPLEADEPLTIRVQITLGCGCPTCAGGRWDASRFRVSARISTLPHANGKTSETSLFYSGTTSQFGGRLMLPVPGRYSAEIMASDPETGLAGRSHLEFALEEAK